MCEKHSYQWTNSAGERERFRQTTHCSKATRRGVQCEEPLKFKHPEGEKPSSSSTSKFPSSNFPPSPPSSDTSSFAEDDRSHKRRSGIYIDVNGKAVTEMSRKPSRRERRGSNHVVIVEPPASPRTPPRYESPRGSPRSPTYIHHARPAQQPAYYTHPEVRLEVNRPRPDSTVHYGYVSPPSKSSGSSSSRTHRDSHSNGSSSASDEVRQLRRKLREAEEAAAKKADRDAAARKAEESRRKKEEEARKNRKVQFDIKKQDEIKKQNEAIAGRPAAPPAPAPQRYRRGSVSVKQTDAMLAEAMQKVQIDADKDRRRLERDLQKQREQAIMDEELAQKERLRARLGSQRGNTVSHSHSSRRPTVVYDDPYR